MILLYAGNSRTFLAQISDSKSCRRNLTQPGQSGVNLLYGIFNRKQGKPFSPDSYLALLTANTDCHDTKLACSVQVCACYSDNRVVCVGGGRCSHFTVFPVLVLLYCSAASITQAHACASSSWTYLTILMRLPSRDSISATDISTVGCVAVRQDSSVCCVPLNHHS